MNNSKILVTRKMNVLSTTAILFLIILTFVANSDNTPTIGKHVNINKILTNLKKQK